VLKIKIQIFKGILLLCSPFHSYGPPEYGEERKASL
jgi:hypothetical protein